MLGVDMPAATMVRELALRGADAVARAGELEETTRWLVEELGAQPPTARLQELLAEVGPPLDPRAGPSTSEVLDEQREDC